MTTKKSRHTKRFSFPIIKHNQKVSFLLRYQPKNHVCHLRWTLGFPLWVFISCTFNTLVFRADGVPSGDAHFSLLNSEKAWGLELVLTFTGAKPNRDKSWTQSWANSQLLWLEREQGIRRLISKLSLLHHRTLS